MFWIKKAAESQRTSYSGGTLLGFFCRRGQVEIRWLVKFNPMLTYTNLVRRGIGGQQYTAFFSWHAQLLQAGMHTLRSNLVQA